MWKWSAMDQAPAELLSDDTAVHCLILRGTDCSTVSVATPTMTGATYSAVCRRLQFDADDDIDDADHQKSSLESSETVLNYLERLHKDQVARWNMDFRTMTPLNGGRWRWTQYPCLPKNDCVTIDDSCSAVSRNVATKKCRRKMSG